MSGKKNRKQPLSRETPSGKKQAKTAVKVPAYDDHKASWRISRIQIVDPYGWHEMTLQEIAQVKGKLASFEKNTWKEIFIRDGRWNHCIPAADLKCPIARQWMKDNIPDQDYIWTLRLSSAERIWGILSENAYQILFWDPNHLIWETTR